MNPYSYGADARLDNFSHYVGASNRLSYYRKNLTKDNSIGDHRWVDRIERKNVDTSQFERKNIEAPRQEKQDTHNYNENTSKYFMKNKKEKKLKFFLKFQIIKLLLDHILLILKQEKILIIVSNAIESLI